MPIRFHRPLGTALGLLAAAGAQAAVSVTTTPSSGPTFTLTPIGSKTRVTLNTSVNTQPTNFLIRASPTDQIEKVLINASIPFQMTFVEIRGGAAGTSIASVDLIDMQTSTSTCVLLDCRTSGNVGAIRINTIADMHIGGDVNGSIILPPRTNGGEASLIAGTVTGRIHGTIDVSHGGIYSLTATAGIGLSGTPVVINSKQSIVRLVAKEIFASIDTRVNGDLGWIGWIETTNGPFVGSLNTRAIATTGDGAPAALIVNGDLDADVALVGGIANDNAGNPVVNIAGRLMPGRTFKIGTTLHAGAQFRIGTPGGMQGQLLINAANSVGLWNGNVIVGGNTLGPVPMYAAISANIGGGAVGHVPFHLHAADCWPTPGSVLGTASAPKPATPIRMRWYGPVNWMPGQAPLVIEASPLSSPGTWIDQTACFTIAREQGLSPHPNVVCAYPSRNLPGGYTYRIRPATLGPAALLCDLGLAVNPSVADDAALHSFTISASCTGDADANGTVNFADISAILTNWAAAAGPCVSSTDANADGMVNFADITAVLSNFGASCP